MNVHQLEIAEIDTRLPALELTATEIAELADELVSYQAEFADLYYRTEQAQWGHKYLQGLLAPLERKAIQPMALALEGGDVQGMQQFIGQGQWQDTRLLQKHWELVAATLGEEDGVYIVDESGFPKKGEHSVGVARQWCGVLGKVENCQVGVFGAYASRRGYTLVDHRLFLPEEWFDAAHRERWEKCGIPDETRFQTKPEIALERLQAVVAAGQLRFRWVTCDELYGRSSDFLDGVAALGRWYLAEVPCDTRVWQTRPQTAVPEWSGHGPKPTKVHLLPNEPSAQRADVIAASLPPQAWQLYVIKEGSKGPLVAEFACVRGVAVRETLPGPDVWIVFRRTLGEKPELKVYLSNASPQTPLKELVRVAGLRWPIETAIEEGKDALGMDHYEVRSWLGWHHHITLCLLAHHFLLRCQQRLKRGPQH